MKVKGFTRRDFIKAAALAALVGSTACSISPPSGYKKSYFYNYDIRAFIEDAGKENIVLGCPTDTSVTISLLTRDSKMFHVEYGEGPGMYTGKSPSFAASSSDGYPVTAILSDLKPNTRYFYRIVYKSDESDPGSTGEEHSSGTQVSKGESFTFGVQGDSHPERAGRMFDSYLYMRLMSLVARHKPDFYIMLGDDFSIERLISRNSITQARVDDIYYNQRNNYIRHMSHSTPLFLVNGNHEQAAFANLSAKYRDAPICAGNARVSIFPLPAPDNFYTGDSEPLEGIKGDGLRRDYYAWTWGDALFITLDPYWHSPAPVDNVPLGNKYTGNRWNITMGNAQYAWLKKTLEESDARFKFVFAHHVNGTGRGGAASVGNMEWGDVSGVKSHRPEWEMPVHHLMVKHNVTIFFFGHDHIYAREMVDGIVYQAVPNPADPTYTPFNCTAYRPSRSSLYRADYDRNYGVIFPNGGFLNVTVTSDNVKVDYIRSYLPHDEKPEHPNGEVAYSYTLPKQPGEKGMQFNCSAYRSKSGRGGSSSRRRRSRNWR